MFSFNPMLTTDTYTLSLHDALPICQEPLVCFLSVSHKGACRGGGTIAASALDRPWEKSSRPFALSANKESIGHWEDRKSTRLNSSHVRSSYAVFCLKKNTRRHSS